MVKIKKMTGLPPAPKKWVPKTILKLTKFNLFASIAVKYRFQTGLQLRRRDNIVRGTLGVPYKNGYSRGAPKPFSLHCLLHVALPLLKVR